MAAFLFLAGHVEHLARYLQEFPGVTFIVDHCHMPMEAGIGRPNAERPDQASVHPGPDVPYSDEVLSARIARTCC
jgi:predicted TIM-barrel fold metal-dependent hydrolase